MHTKEKNYHGLPMLHTNIAGFKMGSVGDRGLSTCLPTSISYAVMGARFGGVTASACRVLVMDTVVIAETSVEAL